MNDEASSIETWNTPEGRLLLTQLGRGEIDAGSTFRRLRLPKWEQSELRRVLKWNFVTNRSPARAHARIARTLAEELDELRSRQAQRHPRIPPQRKDFKGNREHLELIARPPGFREGDNAWNAWRRKHPRTIPDLRGADLSGAFLGELHLEHADLRGARLGGSDLTNAHLRHADLRKAEIFDANLAYADLRDCKLAGAWLNNSDLTYARLQGARLGGALLTSCDLNLADLTGSDLRGMYIWGCSYWSVRLDAATQQSGIKVGVGDFDWIELASEDKPLSGAAFAKPPFEAEVNDLRVAEFISQISDYPEFVAEIIAAASRRLVLLLGRFTGNRKKLLRDIGGLLHEMGYVPMVFDFSPPDSRDVIESVSILAGLSSFVIADLTDARSTPLETQLVIPHLAVPFVPIIRAGKPAFSMFAALQRKYTWVRPLVVYRDEKDLMRRLKTQIIPNAAHWARRLEKQKRPQGPGDKARATRARNTV